MRDAGQPTITIADGITARPLLDADASWVVEAFENPDIQMWHSRHLDLDQAISWIGESAQRWNDEIGANWAVVDDDGEPLGRIGMHTVSLRFGVAEVGYWVLPQHRRRGVATAAVKALSRWALNDLGLHRLALAHSVANQPSCRVAEAAGYIFEGVMRSALRHTDGWHDMHLHARIRTDD